MDELSKDAPAAPLVFFTPVGEFIHSADSKAGTILGVLGIMFTLLARFGGQVEEILRGRGLLMFAAVVLLAVFAASSVAAVVQAFRTISPRFPKAPPSLAFFGDVARLSGDDYVRRVLELTPDQALSERLNYNHTGSRIILIKMAQLRRALRFFEVAAVFWLLLAGMLAVRAWVA